MLAPHPQIHAMFVPLKVSARSPNGGDNRAQFGCHEQLMAWHTTFLDGMSYLLFISVGCGAVDMTIAFFESSEHNVFYTEVAGISLECTETNCRYCVSAVQREAGLKACVFRHIRLCESSNGSICTDGYMTEAH